MPCLGRCSVDALKIVYSAIVGYHVLYMSVRFCWVGRIVQIFYIFADFLTNFISSQEKDIEVTMYYFGLICLFQLYQFLLLTFEALFGAHMFRIVMSFWWIDPFVVVYYDHLLFTPFVKERFQL